MVKKSLISVLSQKENKDFQRNLELIGKWRIHARRDQDSPTVNWEKFFCLCFRLERRLLVKYEQEVITYLIVPDLFMFCNEKIERSKFNHDSDTLSFYKELNRFLSTIVDLFLQLKLQYEDKVLLNLAESYRLKYGPTKKWKGKTSYDISLSLSFKKAYMNQYKIIGVFLSEYNDPRLDELMDELMILCDSEDPKKLWNFWRIRDIIKSTKRLQERIKEMDWK